MIRAVGLLVGFPMIAAALLAADFFGELGLVETLLGALVIIGFAVIAAGWTIDHDV